MNMRWLFVVCLWPIPLLCGCGPQRTDDLIVGKWGDPKRGPGTLIFFKGGTFTLNPTGTTGNYKVLDSTHIRIDFGGPAEVDEITELTNDVLTFGAGTFKGTLKRQSD